MGYDELMNAYNKLQIDFENLRTKSENLYNKNENLHTENENLKIENNVLKRMIFGSKREKTPEPLDINQISIFETEEEVEESVQEQIEEKVEEIIVHRKKNTRKTRAGLKKSILSDCIIKRIECPIEDDTCPDCGNKLKLVYKRLAYQDIGFTPAIFTIREHFEYVYKCNECCTRDGEKESSVFVRTGGPRALLAHSFASPSLATEVIFQKYYLGVPLYRQEKLWDDKGLVLPRNIMSHWCIKLNEYYLEPLWKLMLKKMKQNSELLQADETTLQCNKEPGRKAQSTSYMWVLRSGDLEKQKGVIFKYSSSRSAKTAKEFLEGYKGILVTDRLCFI